MNIYPAFELGGIVYLRVRPEKERGMVTGIRIRKSSGVLVYLYEIQWPYSCTDHYDFELSDTFIPEYQHLGPDESDTKQQ